MTEELERLYLRDVGAMIEALHHTVTALCTEEPAQAGVPLRGAGSVPALLDKAFRYAHSIKSQADAVGRGGVAKAAHVTEDLLSTARTAGLDAVSGEEIRSRVADLRDAFRHEPEVVRTHAGGPRHGGLAARAAALRGVNAATPATSVPDARVAIAAAREQLTLSVRAKVAEAEQRGERAYIVSVFLDSTAAMPDMRIYLIQTNLERAVAVLRTWTVPGGGDSGSASEGAAEAPAFHAVVTTTQGEEELRRLVSVDEVSRVDVDAIGSEQMVPIEWGAGREEPQPRVYPEVPGSVADPAERALLSAEELGQVIASARRAVRDTGIEDPRDREHLLGLLRSAAGLTGRMSEDLDEELSIHFGEIARPVADRTSEIAAERGKRVDVHVRGSWTRLPRGLESTLGDILLQLARNSVDHGIEDAETRAQCGKGATGTIVFGAERNDHWISIWIDDDGRGIDEAAVRALHPDARAEAGLLELLAEPGFTTSSGGSSSSGRGVGLDVVLHTVETLLLGTLELSTTRNKGSRFTARLPAGARAIDVLIVSVGRRRLAVPRMLVDEVRTIRPGDVAVMQQGERFVSVGGSYRPLCSSGLRVVTGSEAVGLVVTGTAGRAVLLAERIVAEERVLRYRRSPYQVYSQFLDRNVALLIPLHGC